MKILRRKKEIKGNYRSSSVLGSMTERVLSSDQGSPHRKLNHDSWKKIDSPYRIEPYIIKTNEDSNPRRLEPEKFTSAFLRVYSQQNILKLQDLEFDNQNQLMKSLNLISEERNCLLEN
jgi:hypothetical protein